MAYSYEEWKKRQKNRTKPSVSAPIFSEFKANYERNNPPVERPKSERWQSLYEFRYNQQAPKSEKARDADADRFAARYSPRNSDGSLKSTSPKDLANEHDAQAPKSQKAKDADADRFAGRYTSEQNQSSDKKKNADADRFAGRYSAEATNPEKYKRPAPVTPKKPVEVRTTHRSGSQSQFTNYVDIPDVQSKKENKPSILSRVFENAKTQLDKPDFHERQLEMEHGGESDMIKGFFQPDNVNDTYSEKSGAGLRLGIGNTVESVSSTMRWLQSKTIPFGNKVPNLGAAAVQKVADGIKHGFEDEQQEFELEDWNDLDYLSSAVPQALPQLLTSILPGLGVASLTGKISKVQKLPKLLRTIIENGAGAGAQATIDSSLEAGGVFDEAIRRGYSEDEARMMANEAFNKNFLLNSGTSFAEMLLIRSKLGKGFAGLNKGAQVGLRTAGGAVTEGLQEGTQEAISASALGDDFSWTDPSTVEAMLLGGILGGGVTGSITGFKEVKDAMTKAPTIDSPTVEVIERSLNELPPEIRQEFDEAVNELEGRDIPREEALEIVTEQLLDRTPAFGDIIAAKTKEYIADKKLEQQSVDTNPVLKEQQLQEELAQAQPPLEEEPPSLLNMEMNEQVPTVLPPPPPMPLAEPSEEIAHATSFLEDAVNQSGAITFNREDADAMYFNGSFGYDNEHNQEIKIQKGDGLISTRPIGEEIWTESGIAYTQENPNLEDGVNVPTESETFVEPLNDVSEPLDVLIGDTVNLQGTRPDTGYVVEAVDGDMVQVQTPNQKSIKVPKSRIANLLHREEQEAELEQQLEQQNPLESVAFEQQIPQETTTSEQQIPQEVIDPKRQEIIGRLEQVLSDYEADGDTNNAHYQEVQRKVEGLKNGAEYSMTNVAPDLIGAVGGMIPTTNKMTNGEKGRPTKADIDNAVKAGKEIGDRVRAETKEKPQLDKSDVLAKKYQTKIRKAAKDAGINLKDSVTFVEGMMKDEITSSLLESHNIKNAESAFVAGKSVVSKDKNSLNIDVQLSRVQIGEPITQEVIHEFAEVWLEVWKQGNKTQYNQAVSFLKAKGMNQARAEEMLAEILTDYTISNQLPKVITENSVHKKFFGKIVDTFKHWVKDTLTRISYYRKEVWNQLSPEIQEQAKLFEEGKWKEAFANIKDSEFDSVERYALKKTKGIGKKIGSTIYVHKSAINSLDADAQSRINEITIPKDFGEYEIIKYDKKTNNVSFIKSPDWDTKDEPTVGDSIMFKADGTHNITKGRKTNQQIYHHKWMMVAEDYKGFDVAESKKRSEQWENSDIDFDRKKIGNSDYWNETVASKLDKPKSSVVEPTSDLWKRGPNFADVKAMYPTLFDTDPDQEKAKRHPTQVTNTVKTYNNFYNHLEKEGFEGSILDASSGLGLGTKAGRERGFKVDDVEIYPDSDYKPKYTSYADIKEQYDVIISSSVINVIPQDFRDSVVADIGNKLKDGGRAFITARALDSVESSSSKLSVHVKDAPTDPNGEYFMPHPRNSFQKGFKSDELIAYVKDVLASLPGDFTVEKMTFGNSGVKTPSGVTVTRKNGAKYSIKELGADPILADYEKYFGVRNPDLLEEFKKNPESFDTYYRGEIVPVGDGTQKNIANAIAKKEKKENIFEGTLMERMATPEGRIEISQEFIESLRADIEKMVERIRELPDTYENAKERLSLRSDIEAKQISIANKQEIIAKNQKEIDRRKRYSKGKINDLLYVTSQKENAEDYANAFEGADESVRPEGYDPKVFNIKTKFTKMYKFPKGEKGTGYINFDEVYKALSPIVSDEVFEQIIENAGIVDETESVHTYKLFRGENAIILPQYFVEAGYDSINYTEGDQDNYIVLDRKKVLYQHEWESVVPNDQKKKEEVSTMSNNTKVTVPKKYQHMIKELFFEGGSDNHYVAHLNDGFEYDGSKTIIEKNQKDLLDAIKHIEIAELEKQEKHGTTGETFTENGTKIEFEYRVVEASELIVSNDSTGKVNPNYPKELQPRDRSREASQVQVQKIAQKLNPVLVGESSKASDGAPIVGPDMVVESGNGRTMAIQKMYEELYSPWQEYNEFLGKNADKFGLDKTAIHEMEYPILVRVRTNEVDRKKFVTEANVSSIAAMSTTEQAMVDAEKITEKLLREFFPGENGDLNVASNSGFMTGFLGSVASASERGRLVTAKGDYSQELISRVRNAIFAKAYGNAEAISILSESTDNNIRNITNAMLQSAPKFVSMKEGIKKGSLIDEDITQDIVDAMIQLSNLRKEGRSVQDFLNKPTLDLEFSDALTDAAKEMLNIFDHKVFKRSSKKLSELFNGYADELFEIKPNGFDLGLNQVTKAEILALAMKRVRADEVQISLFETENENTNQTGTNEKEKPKAKIKPGQTELPSVTKRTIAHILVNGNDPTYNENISVGDDVYFDIGRTRFIGTVLEIPPADDPRGLAIIDTPSGRRTVIRNKLVAIDEKPKTKANMNEEGFASRKKDPGPPTDGTETVDSTQTDKTVTRSQIIDFVQTHFDVTVGTGKTSGRLGFYKNKFAIMRTKDYADFEVVFHELGHRIDQRIGLSRNSKVRDEFIKLAEHNLELPVSMTKDTRAKEGVAEYFRQVFYNENLSNEAMKIKDLSPELRKIVSDGLSKQKWNKPTTELKRMTESWMNRDGEQELGGIYSPIGQKRKNKRTVKSIMNEVYTRVYEKDHPIWVAMRLIEKETGLKIDSNLDAYARAVLTRGTVARAATFVKGRTFDEHGRITGESFEAILEDVDNVENFDKYLIAKHALHLKTEKGKHKTPITPEKIEEYLASAKPEYEALAKRVYKYQQRALQVLVDGGLIDPKLPAKLKEKYPFYVPFYRVTTEDGMRDGPSGKGVREGQYANNQNGLKGMKEHGSTKNIISPIESIIKNTHLYFSLADHNSVGRALAEFANPNNPLAAEITRTIIEAVSPDLRVTEIALEQIEKTLLNAGLEQEMTEELDMKAIAKIFEPIFRPNASKNEVMVWVDGKPQMFKIRDPLLYDALVAQDSRAINDIARYLFMPLEIANKALRQGITMSPFFTVITFARSAMQLGIKTEAKGLNYFTQPGRVVKAWKSIINKDDALYDWWASGGAQSTFIATENDYLTKELEHIALNRKTKDMLKQKTSMKEKRELAFYMSKKGLGMPFKMLNVFNDVLDQSIKLAEYQVVMKQTGGDRVKAALASREADLDYKRFGSTGMQFANKYWLFWNVAFQGPDNLIRYAAKNKVAFGLRGFLLVTLPTLILYAINRDDEEYQELTTFERDMYWNVPKGDGTFWKIKIPFEAGILFKTIPEKLFGEFLDYTKGEDKQSWKDFRKNTTETMLVNFLPTLFDVAAEYMAERDLETGRDTVPMGVQSANKPDEYDERTSEIFKAVGKFFNRSPILLEHAFKSLTGQMGQFYLYSTDVALDKLGIVDRPDVKGLTRTFPQRTFQTSVNDGSTNAIDTFYPEYERLKQDHKDNGVNGRPSPLLKAFGRANDDMIALRKVKKGMFYNHLVQPDGSPFPYDEKKRRVEIIDNALRDIARDVQGLEPLDQEGLEEAWKMAEGYKDYVKYNNKVERDKYDENK